MSSQFDQTTNMVIEWLIYHKIKYFRVNGETGNKSIDIEITEDGKCTIEVIDRFDRKLSFDEFSSFWYRRGDWQIAFPGVKRHKKNVSRILKDEWSIVREALHYIMDRKKSLGSLEKDKYQNKIKSLLVAAKLGINVPETMITTNKNKLIKKVKSKDIITKAIYNMFQIVSANLVRRIGTKSVNGQHLAFLEQCFFPTLVQTEIPKAYELRIFFIKEKFYSMAIFSQMDEMTKVDFRNYNREKPNRCLPFKLPEEIKCKLVQFNKIMNLDTGSIDMIVTPDNKFYFIEVNPIGQFGWVSKNCNYRLEEKIALYFKTSDT